MLIIALVSVFGVFASAERSDFNNDGNVNLEDFFLFAQSFSARAGDILYESKYDLDSNNKVDMEDFNIFSGDFNEKISPSYKEVSKYPLMTRDISFVVENTFVPNNYFDLIRDLGGDLVEQVELI